jgi:hypothetical protein
VAAKWGDGPLGAQLNAAALAWLHPGELPLNNQVIDRG